MNLKLIAILGTVFVIACNSPESTGTAEPTQASAPAAATEPNGPVYVLNQLEGDLYHATSDSHSTLVLLTPEGAILADPLNVGFAEWLKSELATRFDTTVRYVLYSHHHWDHASGGAVFLRPLSW